MYMDRRQSLRIPAAEPILLTCLGSDGEPSAPYAAQMVDQSEYGIRIAIRERIAPSTVVRLDIADGLLLGEVAWCAEAGDGYHVGIHLEQSLQHLGHLRTLVASLLGQDERRPLDQSQAVEARRD